MSNYLLPYFRYFFMKSGEIRRIKSSRNSVHQLPVSWKSAQTQLQFSRGWKWISTSIFHIYLRS